MLGVLTGNCRKMQKRKIYIYYTFMQRKKYLNSNILNGEST